MTDASDMNRSPDDSASGLPAGNGGGKSVASNVIWNWAGMLVALLSGFLVLPFLVKHLGETVYGLWILIASLTNYFSLLDLGVRGSVGRYVAYYKARQDPAGVNAILNTSLLILCAVAVICVLATFAALYLFFVFIQVPPEVVGATRMALLLVGLNFALTFPLMIFDGLLWAFQRFDLINIVDIPMCLLRVGLTVALVGTGGGLVSLAVLTIIVTVLTGVIKGVLCFKVDPDIRIGARFIDRAVVWTIYAFGIWSFLLSVARELRNQVAPLMVGHHFGLRGPALVTLFSTAARLVGYAGQFLIAATGVLTPLSTTLHAQERHDQQRQLFLHGGKYCMSLSLYFLGLFLLLGQWLLFKWMGSSLDNASLQLTWQILWILALGEVLPMSQWVTNSMALGMARHKVLAMAGLVEGVIAITLSIILMPSMGVLGLCLGFSIAGTLCRGMYQLFYGCQLAQVRVSTYVWQAVFWPLAAAAVPAAALWLWTERLPYVAWWNLFAAGAVYSLLYAASAWLILGAGDPLGGRLRQRSSSRGAAADDELELKQV